MTTKDFRTPAHRNCDINLIARFKNPDRAEAITLKAIKDGHPKGGFILAQGPFGTFEIWGCKHKK